MGNKIDDMEQNAGIVTGVLGALGLASAYGLKKLYNNSQKEARKQEIQFEIQQIDREIDNLSSGFFGSLMNGSEIDRLKSKKAALKKELSQL